MQRHFLYLLHYHQPDSGTNPLSNTNTTTVIPLYQYCTSRATTNTIRRSLGKVFHSKAQTRIFESHNERTDDDLLFVIFHFTQFLVTKKFHSGTFSRPSRTGPSRKTWKLKKWHYEKILSRWKAMLYWIALLLAALTARVWFPLSAYLGQVAAFRWFFCLSVNGGRQKMEPYTIIGVI